MTLNDEFSVLEAALAGSIAVAECWLNLARSAERRGDVAQAIDAESNARDCELQAQKIRALLAGREFG